jgi:hypothetical protein
MQTLARRCSSGAGPSRPAAAVARGSGVQQPALRRPLRAAAIEEKRDTSGSETSASPVRRGADLAGPLRAGRACRPAAGRIGCRRSRGGRGRAGGGRGAPRRAPAPPCALHAAARRRRRPRPAPDPRARAAPPPSPPPLPVGPAELGGVAPAGRAPQAARRAAAQGQQQQHRAGALWEAPSAPRLGRAVAGAQRAAPSGAGTRRRGAAGGARGGARARQRGPLADHGDRPPSPPPGRARGGAAHLLAQARQGAGPGGTACPARGLAAGRRPAIEAGAALPVPAAAGARSLPPPGAPLAPRPGPPPCAPALCSPKPHLAPIPPSPASTPTPRRCWTRC